jgi:hypothetical protein
VLQRSALQKSVLPGGATHAPGRLTDRLKPRLEPHMHKLTAYLVVGWLVLGIPICLFGGEALGWSADRQIVAYFGVLAVILAVVYWREKPRREGGG